MAKSAIFVILCIVLTSSYEIDYDRNQLIKLENKSLKNANNQRYCPLQGGKDSLGTFSYFNSRCEGLGFTLTKCMEAWSLFSSVWNQTLDAPDYSAFLNYFNWQESMKQLKQYPVFYAGSGLCPDLVHRLTNVPNIGLTTLEDQAGPYFVANAAWCTPEEFNTTTGACSNSTTWGTVPNGDKQPNYFSGAAFWTDASHRFADAAFGTVYLLLRTYAKSAAWKQGSILQSVELPMIMNQTDVTGLRVVVITNQLMTEEKCKDGSLLQLESQIGNRWSDYSCVNDPLAILRFICDDDTLKSSVDIIDKDAKCEYYHAVKEYFGTGVSDYNLNCSTDTVMIHYDNKWIKSWSSESSKHCPEPRKIYWGMMIVSVIICFIMISIITIVLVCVVKWRRERKRKALFDLKTFNNDDFGPLLE